MRRNQARRATLDALRAEAQQVADRLLDEIRRAMPGAVPEGHSVEYDMTPLAARYPDAIETTCREADDG